MAPLTVRKRTQFLSRIIASSALAPRATCAASPPMGASSEMNAVTELVYR